MTTVEFAPHYLTANSFPPYTITMSSVFSGTFTGYKAFDGAWGTAQYWVASTNTGWLQIDCGVGAAYNLESYTVKVNSIPEPNRAPKDWTVLGSNDASTWATLSTVTGQTSWGSAEERTFNVRGVSRYRYFRIDVTANNGDTYLSIAELYLQTRFGYNFLADMRSRLDLRAVSLRNSLK